MKKYDDIEIDGNTTYYWLNHTLHRLDGPAVEYEDGGYQYYRHGKLHRLDGPAIYSGGSENIS